MANHQDKDVNALVERHIAEMRYKVAEGLITEADHDTIGFLFGKVGGYMIHLTDNGWQELIRIVDESRAFHGKQQ
jgi:hypothetical protein